jgi:hypothetical protein
MEDTALAAGRLNSVSLHLISPELMARGLDAFTRAKPSLTSQVTLFDRHGRQVWPPKVARDMSLFDPQRYADPRASADWWKFGELNAAKAKAESQMVNDYYERQARLKEARERAGK